MKHPPLHVHHHVLVRPRHMCAELLCAAFFLLCCEPDVVSGGTAPRFSTQRLEKMHNVIVCYADWAQCDAKVLLLVNFTSLACAIRAPHFQGTCARRF
jgi:hypothetical protein